MTEPPSGARARRNRLIAIAAALLTIIAMALGFAWSVLRLGWHWMQPAGELLLLDELVGLVVLERRQLFEPAHEKVTAMGADLTDVRPTLGLVTQQSGRLESDDLLFEFPRAAANTGANLIRSIFSRSRGTANLSDRAPHG
jgi:hypothetical protein